MPLLFDMSWEELQTYEGTNPRPADFDDYWDRGLRELDSADPEVEYVPSPFQTSFAECFDMFFTGVGGARIHAKLVRPKNAPEPHPAVLMFHGYTGDDGGRQGTCAQDSWPPDDGKTLATGRACGASGRAGALGAQRGSFR